MVRYEEEKKPLRIWLQIGSNDLENKCEHWPSAFMVMVEALKFKEYDFEYVFEEGLGHTYEESSNTLSVGQCGAGPA